MPDQKWYSLDISQSLHFQNNLKLFQEHHPELAQVIESGLEGLCDYEFFKLDQGQYLCRNQSRNEIFYQQLNFRGALQSNLDKLLNYYQKEVELTVIAGTGLGYLASHTEDAIRGNLRWGILLLENRPELIAAQFSLFDCQLLIESEQVFWAIGHSMTSALEDCFRKHRLDLIPFERIAPIQERWFSDQERFEMQQAGAWIAGNWKKTNERINQLEIKYNDSIKKPCSLDNGCIWGFATPMAYAHTPLIRAFMQGFEALGWSKQLLEMKDSFTTRYCVIENLFETCPDLFFVCNTASSTFSLLAEDINRPRVTWILDHPRYFAADTLKENLISKDFVFYIDRIYGSELNTTKAAVCKFMPATASFTKQGVFRDEFAVPILFVGSYHDASEFMNSLPPQTDKEINAIIEYLIQYPTKTGRDAIASMRISDRTMEILLSKALIFTDSIKNRLTDDERRIDYFLYSLSNSQKRERTVRQLLDLGLVIYGPDSWLKVTGQKYASQYRGWMESDDLADAYASADLVLNIHSLQCPTCLNPRDFDVLAAGGCLVCDWVDDLDQGIIAPGEDCFTTRHLADLPALIKKLLNDPEKRDEVRQHGHQTYLDRHTPKHRAQEVIDIIKANYK